MTYLVLDGCDVSLSPPVHGVVGEVDGGLVQHAWPTAVVYDVAVHQAPELLQRLQCQSSDGHNCHNLSLYPFIRLLSGHNLPMYPFIWLLHGHNLPIYPFIRLLNGHNLPLYLFIRLLNGYLPVHQAPKWS